MRPDHRPTAVQALLTAVWIAGSLGNKLVEKARVRAANCAIVMLGIGGAVVSALYHTLPAFSQEWPPIALAAL